MVQHRPRPARQRRARRVVRARVARRIARSTFHAWSENELLAGALLLGAATLGLVWANSPWQDALRQLADIRLGPAALGLDLSVSQWVVDGLLAIFFFTVGTELKQEFVVGQLRSLRTAAVPVLAAVGGMIGPAVVFLTIVLVAGDADGTRGWAIPTATDIAFAVGVLAVFGKGLPTALRTFLLTLAVVDDLLAIAIIAIVYTATIDGLWLGVSIAAIVAFAGIIRSRRAPWWLLVPIALIAWGAMHASGVHATIAGVLLGLTVPARPRFGERSARTHQLIWAIVPWSTLVVLPLFALFAAAVTIVPGEFGGAELAVFCGVGLGLLAGKVLGVMGTTSLLTWLTPLRLADGVRLRDLWPVAALTGIGFTVAMLIAELAFGDDPRAGAAKLAVLAASVIAAVLGAALLRTTARRR
ncbi:MAG TPA: Na+/H+ antiporter NhaA [Microbacteriaceae bacterium]|nr:Na+/H+ antiporter NhaA [Microbacteriaceae bacterium]